MEYFKLLGALILGTLLQIISDYKFHIFFVMMICLLVWWAATPDNAIDKLISKAHNPSATEIISRYTDLGYNHVRTIDCDSKICTIIISKDQ
jgi:hypothetical protein